jgi:hypothetical protein
MWRDGRLGGAANGRKGGIAKARKTSELAQQLVEDNRRAIETNLREILRSGSRSQKLKAIELLMKSGLAAERVAVQVERTELEGATREQLIATLAEGFRGPSGAIMARALAEHHDIDSTAVELGD